MARNFRDPASGPSDQSLQPPGGKGGSPPCWEGWSQEVDRDLQLWPQEGTQLECRGLSVLLITVRLAYRHRTWEGQCPRRDRAQER